MDALKAEVTMLTSTSTDAKTEVACSNLHHCDPTQLAVAKRQLEEERTRSAKLALENARLQQELRKTGSGPSVSGQLTLSGQKSLCQTRLVPPSHGPQLRPRYRSWLPRLESSHLLLPSRPPVSMPCSPPLRLC